MFDTDHLCMGTKCPARPFMLAQMVWLDLLCPDHLCSDRPGQEVTELEITKLETTTQQAIVTLTTDLRSYICSM